MISTWEAGFSATGDLLLNDLGYIARFDNMTNSWHALPNKGMNDRIKALAASKINLFAGGQFTAAGDGSLQELGNVVRCSLEFPFKNAYLPLVIKR